MLLALLVLSMILLLFSSFFKFILFCCCILLLILLYFIILIRLIISASKLSNSFIWGGGFICFKTIIYFYIVRFIPGIVRKKNVCFHRALTIKEFILFIKGNLYLLYTHNHNNTTIKTQEDFFIKIYVPLTLFVRFEKVIQGLRVRGSWRPNRTEIFGPPPPLMAVNVVSFSFFGCSTGGPGVHSAGCWLSLLHLLWSPNTIRVPEGPFGRVWLSLPHLFYYSVRSLTGTGTALTSVFTELYNSSTPTRSPTRSLKSHVWCSSQVTLSSGASVYECTMGIFLPRPISSANFRACDFLS